MIEISNLKKVWEDGTVTLEDINIDSADGDVYALVGRSGAGKSTLLRCINGLTDYQEGSIKVDGREVKDMGEKELRELRRHAGMIFQHFSLLERETVFKNVALPMKCWKYSKEEQKNRVMELLDLVGLADNANARPRNLSGGQKQRVAIARALTMDAKYLLCDEATSALDPKTTTAILDLLLEINKKTGITVIIVTHQMEVVRRACQRACILEHGVIKAEGPVDEIFFDEPDALRRLLGEERRILPPTGHNMRICQPFNAVEDGALFNEMSLELGYASPILGGQILEYRDEKIGMFTINVDDEHFEEVDAYLARKGLKWREMLPMKHDDDSEQ